MLIVSMPSDKHHTCMLAFVVAPGCLEIDNITNGEVKSLLNGSVVEITCYPDKIRQGEAILSCDGQHWSSATPLCLGM